MNKYRIRINGKVYELEIELIASPEKHDSYSPVGISYNRAEHSNDNSASVGGLVKSPMPGCVVEILVKPGDMVKANDVILIIESMKMENEVCATKTGRLKTLFVSKGQSIASGDELFELED